MGYCSDVVIAMKKRLYNSKKAAKFRKAVRETGAQRLGFGEIVYLQWSYIKWYYDDQYYCDLERFVDENLNTVAFARVGEAENDVELKGNCLNLDVRIKSIIVTPVSYE